MNLTNGKGANVTVDAVGDSRVVLQAADLVKKMGEVVILGSPRSPYETNITLLLRIVHLNWITLKGALEWRFPLYEASAVNIPLKEIPFMSAGFQKRKSYIPRDS